MGMMSPASWWWFLLLLAICHQADCLSTYFNERSKCRKREIIIPRRFYVEEHELPIKVEVSNRITHQLVSHIFRILVNEEIGYPDVRLVNSGGAERGLAVQNAIGSLQRISNCIDPNTCRDIKLSTGPEAMVNLEVWMNPGFNLEAWTNTKQVENCGSLGPIGRSGWLVPDHAIKEMLANGIILDNWRAFKNSDVTKLFDMIGDKMLVTLNPNTNTTYCTYKECGTDGIYRPKQCSAASHIRCATLLADYPGKNFSWLTNIINKLNLYVNIAWVGDGLFNTVLKRTSSRNYTIFYHNKPSFLSSLSNYSLVAFPPCEDGGDSTCNFSIYQLEKIAWSKIKTNAPLVFHLLRSMSFTQKAYYELLEQYNYGKTRGYDVEQIACTWVMDNAIKWDKWIPDGLTEKIPLYLGGIFPFSGVYRKQSGIVPAARMAVDAINANNSLLTNYRLELLEQDGKCVADQVMKSFINYITNATYPTLVGILGPACSDTVEPIAGVAKHFNTIIISYSAEGSLFTDREKYPYFFRTIPENHQFQYVYLKLFKKFQWKRVAAFTENGQKYAEYVSRLQEISHLEGIDFISNKKFFRERASQDMKRYLQDLKDKNARIIIGDFYDYAARAVMCGAYQMGMTSANGYQWFLPLWFSPDWFDTDFYNSMGNHTFENVECTTEQMIDAINGHFSLAYKFYGDSDATMQEGRSVDEWLRSYRTSVLNKNMETSPYGGYAYDAVWVYATALNSLFQENNSYAVTLHSDRTSKRFAHYIKQTNFTGVSGPLHFVNSSRLSEVVIWQWRRKHHYKIGVYRPYSQTDGELELNETSVVWLTGDGLKPNDGRQRGNSCVFEEFKRRLGTSCEMAILVVNMIAISVLIVMTVFVVAAFKRRYEMRLKKSEARIKELGLMATGSLSALDEWEMPRDHIVINRKLGEGAFGTVFGGEAFIENKGWVAVAVKTLKLGAKTEEKLDFLSEAEVMKKFDHTNVVKLIGVCTMGEPVYNIMEFMLYGDLKTYLLGRRNLVTETDRSKNDEVSDRRLTNMALDIARGLSYLANLNYVHRDLACRNCLVNASRSVKIADFGMCRPMYDSDYYRFNRKGMLPVRWMAPESLTDGLFSPKSDVWSYGVLMYEIVTFGSFPYQGLSNNQVLEHVKNNNTLNVPKGCKPALEDMLKKCWSRLPQNRPQAVEIVELLASDSELISPCLDMPIASVEAEDTESLEITINDRSRVHSVSSAWLTRRRVSTPEGVTINIEDPNLFNIKDSGNTTQIELKPPFSSLSKNHLGHSMHSGKHEQKPHSQSFRFSSQCTRL